jgi:hypothetical protein
MFLTRAATCTTVTLTAAWATKGTAARATGALVTYGSATTTATGGGGDRRRRRRRRCFPSSSSSSSSSFSSSAAMGGEGSAADPGSAELSVHSPTTHGIDPGVVEKALDVVLSDEGAAYLVPMYVGDDGGHDHRVSQWFKSEGAAVAADEAVCEIETTEFLYDFGPKEAGFLALRAVEADVRVEDRDLVALLAPTEKDLVDFRGRFEEACGGILALQAEADAAAQTAKLAETCPELEALLVSTGMERYLETFIEDGFDTRAALDTVTDDDLKELDVKAGHRRVLLAALEEMSPDDGAGVVVEEDKDAGEDLEPPPPKKNTKKKNNK